MTGFAASTLVELRSRTNRKPKLGMMVSTYNGELLFYVTDDSAQHSFDSDKNEHVVSVPVEAVSVGCDYNTGPHTIKRILTKNSGFTACTNPAAANGGADPKHECA